jgi:hypothetical protein
MPSRSFTLAFLALLPFACTRTAEPPSVATPAPTPAPSPAAVLAASAATAASATPAASNGATRPDAAPPPRKAIVAWTDPEAVAELTLDCAWQPSDAEQTTDENATNRYNPLSCKFLYEQSCVPDPCLEVQEEKCKPTCAATCGACGERCSATCTACKRACTDDGCKRACATSCGACRQSCVQAADRCVTGTCGAARERCNAARDALLAKHRRACEKACEPASQCPGPCSEEGDPSACMARCRKRFVAGGCPDEFFSVCVMSGAGAFGPPRSTP